VFPWLPFEGVLLLLGNDIFLAGIQVMANPCVSKVPQNSALFTGQAPANVCKLKYMWILAESSRTRDVRIKKVVGNQIFVVWLPNTFAIMIWKTSSVIVEN